MPEQRPPNVSSPDTGLVMPWRLCVRFESASEFVTLRHEYQNGESQRCALTRKERRQWRVARKFVASDSAAFLLFFEQVKGGQSFYFYDPWETVPRFHYDSTGAALNGRYRVRFAGGLSMTAGFPRVEADLELIEVS